MRDGELVLEGLSDEEIRVETRAYLGQLADDPSMWEGADPIMIRRDYEGTLASEAAGHHDAGHFNIAILLQATRVEHWLDHMLVWGVFQLG